MDFVVVGLGIGAFAVLLGLAIRDLGPLFRRIPRDGAMPWSEVTERVGWGRRCRAAGLVVAIAGAALCLITGVALLSRVSDSTGMWIVLGAVVLAVVAFAAWALRYHTRGRTPSMPRSMEERLDGRKPAQRPARKSALAGIRSNRPNLARRPAGVDTAVAPDDAPPVRQASDVAAPMGALTVDASGAMRRTPVGVPAEPTSPTSPAGPAPRKQRSSPASTPAPASGSRSETYSPDSRTTGRGGPKGDPFRR